MFGIRNPQNVIQGIKVLPNLYTNLQTVRWRRKPRWLPVARSKMFRVAPRTETPEDEKVELRRLYNNYNTLIKSIRGYFYNQYNVKEEIDTEKHEKQFMEDFETCCKINDEWNAEVRVMREERQKKELDREIEIALAKLDAQTKKKKDAFRAMEDLVKKEIEASKDFITTENIDIVIEHAINNPIDYNFSIDLQGNIYSGRKTKPETVKNSDSA